MNHLPNLPYLIAMFCENGSYKVDWAGIEPTIFLLQLLAQGDCKTMPKGSVIPHPSQLITKLLVTLAAF